MSLPTLEATARALLPPGKGILAADESLPTMEKRLRAIGVPPTEENRRAWRELLFSAAGIGDFISGVILFDETIRQRASDGTPLGELLQRAGVIPGIKVDQGAKPLAGSPAEKVTEGLDGLRQRLQEYAELGARFTKWRAVITIGPGLPTSACLEANAHALARFAALSQEAGLVPIVEPEVLMDGDHDIGRCFEATERILQRLYPALFEQGVRLEGTLLKPNMVLSGKDAPDRAAPDQVAAETIRCFRRAVPAAVPGVVFLSGGQSDDEATRNLDALNRRAQTAPWQLSFSYGRGLLATPLTVWGGQAANRAKAQAAFLHRAKVLSAARRGRYSPQLEEELVGV